MTLTLWDLVDPPSSVRPAVRPTRPRAEARRTSAERYLRMEREMLARFGVRVRKWRSGTSGVAWEVHYESGRVSRLIESPRPRGPVSAAVFLHEIGHHAIGFTRYKLRCLEEYHAWRFSLEQMEAWDLHVTDRVRARVRDSLSYAVDKARRRGLRQIPLEVVECIAAQQALLAASAAQRSAKSASTNASGSKGWMSSGVSPMPTNLTGSPS